MISRAKGSSRSARHTKIVCTIGPSTFSKSMIERLAKAGMDVARLNFSHGDWEQHARTIGNIRAVARELNKPIGILQDLAGPKLRIGNLAHGEIELRRNHEVVLSASEETQPDMIPLPLPEVPKALSKGDRVLLADGAIELVVVEAGRGRILGKVRVGGTLRSHQGVHLPDVALPIDTVTKKDIADLRFGIEHEVDWVAMSFVRRASDLKPLSDLMGESEKHPALMAKIEQHEALDHLDEIVDAADGVMVARGDLGIELPLDRVPMLQKSIIRCCNRMGKPVVTATQMLESMIDRRRPTRAEVSDVANAVLDGTDAVMLSGETAVGRYPVEAVRVMDQVAVRAEASFNYAERLSESSQWPCQTVTDGISQATVNLAHDLDARAIITATTTGHTALMVAMHRPERPIIAVTPDVATQRKLAMAWGVRPLLARRGGNTDALILNAIDRAREEKLLAEGDVVVITAGVPAGVPGQTNLIKVEVVGKHEHF